MVMSMKVICRRTGTCMCTDSSFCMAQFVGEMARICNGIQAELIIKIIKGKKKALSHKIQTHASGTFST